MSSIFPAHLRLSEGGVSGWGGGGNGYVCESDKEQFKCLSTYVTELIYIHYFSFISIQLSMIAHFLLDILCTFTPRSWNKVILLATELLLCKHCSKASRQWKRKDRALLIETLLLTSMDEFPPLFLFCRTEQSFPKVPLRVKSFWKMIPISESRRAK